MTCTEIIFILCDLSYRVLFEIQVSVIHGYFDIQNENPPSFKWNVLLHFGWGCIIDICFFFFLATFWLIFSLSFCPFSLLTHYCCKFDFVFSCFCCTSLRAMFILTIILVNMLHLLIFTNNLISITFSKLKSHQKRKKKFTGA